MLINLVISASKCESQWSLITAGGLCQISVVQVSVVRMNVSRRAAAAAGVCGLENAIVSCGESG